MGFMGLQDFENGGCLNVNLLYCRSLGPTLHGKRQYLERRLTEIGFKVLPAQGTYFLIADFR